MSPPPSRSTPILLYALIIIFSLLSFGSFIAAIVIGTQLRPRTSTHHLLGVLLSCSFSLFFLIAAYAIAIRIVWPALKHTNTNILPTTTKCHGPIQTFFFFFGNRRHHRHSSSSSSGAISSLTAKNENNFITLSTIPTRTRKGYITIGISTSPPPPPPPPRRLPIITITPPTPRRAAYPPTARPTGSSTTAAEKRWSAVHNGKGYPDPLRSHAPVAAVVMQEEVEEEEKEEEVEEELYILPATVYVMPK
ncbi:MAG: hypothetical protein M1836_006124 [Candelina mexicana]|nr:MAG: hypothetical protein M1836_006124 [Candelina mexicana]